MFTPSPLVVGLDVGGTSTRVVVADLDGRRRGAGAAGGGNPIARGRDVAVANIADALRQGMDGLDASAVAGVVMGAAGMLSAGPEFVGVFDPIWRRAGIDAPVRTVGDPLVAFAAGSPAPSGTVLIAGTGAIASAVADHDLSGLRDDGYGWLLGDTGSGFWLGRRAVHHTLRHLNGHEPSGPLTAAVLDALALADPTVETVIGRVMAEPPIRLAEFAPIVTSTAVQGDPAALAIVVEAADELCAKVATVHRDPSSPIVLAGSLLSGDTPVADAVRARLRTDHRDAPVRVAHDGAAGAAWLAARAVTDDDAALTAMHRGLFGAD